jgi:hypothetical protein
LLLIQSLAAFGRNLPAMLWQVGDRRKILRAHRAAQIRKPRAKLPAFPIFARLSVGPACVKALCREAILLRSSQAPRTPRAGFSRADQEFAPILGARVLVVAARFNARVVALLREGAMAELAGACGRGGKGL